MALSRLRSIFPDSVRGRSWTFSTRTGPINMRSRVSQWLISALSLQPDGATIAAPIWAIPNSSVMLNTAACASYGTEAREVINGDDLTKLRIRGSGAFFLSTAAPRREGVGATGGG
jgi:hypothetical protein